VNAKSSFPTKWPDPTVARTGEYSCTFADVLLPDGTNVNQVLVKDGWCWWYRKYAPLDIELEKLEKDAGEAKKGLWADPALIAPWLYRKAKCGQVLGLLKMVPLDSGVRERREGRLLIACH
jgi:endonuclease YncB( thermonuclease family)